MILSIVIPVYNVEEYIEKCLVSCSNQDISKNDYELIVVNDGSPDKSLEICERLLPSIENMTIVSQENRDLSGARNTGLKYAKGNYVWFVDSDDWLEENCLDEIISRIKEHQSDFFWLGHDVVSNDKVIDTFIPNKLVHPISGEDFFINHLNDLFYIWKFIYKRELLGDGENTIKTHHDKIMIAKAKDIDCALIKPKIIDICNRLDTTSKTELVSKMKEIIPEYISNNSEYELLDKETVKTN
ncbi:MAG: glycosyltransferase family 2 protein [Urechidicola sp.]|nr:glycosyltransferase family 2 protein [Urechidicola sp.]